jgi:hypothetical protein
MAAREGGRVSDTHSDHKASVRSESGEHKESEDGENV